MDSPPFRLLSSTKAAQHFVCLDSLSAINAVSLYPTTCCQYTAVTKIVPRACGPNSRCIALGRYRVGCIYRRGGIHVYSGCMHMVSTCTSHQKTVHACTHSMAAKQQTHCTRKKDKDAEYARHVRERWLISLPASFLLRSPPCYCWAMPFCRWLPLCAKIVRKNE